MFESGAADWFERQRPKAPKLSDGHRRCIHVLAQVCHNPGSMHNLPTPVLPADAIELLGDDFGISAVIRGELATFDGSELTRLVIAAHRYHVRVAVRPWLVHLADDPRPSIIAEHISRECDVQYEPDDPAIGHGLMEIMLTTREPTGSNFERHPTLADLAAKLEP